MGSAIAAGRPPAAATRAKGVLVSAHEIETAVLRAAGVEQTGLTSKEEEAALRSAIRQAIFKADTGRIEIEFQPGGVARRCGAPRFGGFG